MNGHDHTICIYPIYKFPGMDAGDVVFILQEKAHPEFIRKNADLFIKRQVTLLEALTGAQFEVTHLDGRKLLIKTKPGEVISPARKEEVPWEVFPDTQCGGEDHGRADTTDIKRLKEVGGAILFSSLLVVSSTRNIAPLSRTGIAMKEDR